MKRLLVVVMLLGMVVLGAASASADDGCASLTRQLKEKGLIDANKEADIVNECKGKANVMRGQCASACATSSANAPRGVGIGCKIGCEAFANMLVNN